MDSQLKKGFIEYCVLAQLNRDDSYGYLIVKNISKIMPTTESTLYPVLKRLETNSKVETYTKVHNGRLRKYYKITEEGVRSTMIFLQEEWPKIEEMHDYIKGGFE